MIVFKMEDLKYLMERLEKIETKHDKKLDAILIQTTKTNGRVTSLEETVKEHHGKIEQHTQNMNQTIGRDKTLLVVAGAIGTLIGIIVSYFLSK